MASWGCDFRSKDESDKTICLQNYQRHNERVQELIPPERLLVYNWEDGWAPLAHFLGLPIPEADFPHTDTVMENLEYKAALQGAASV